MYSGLRNDLVSLRKPRSAHLKQKTNYDTNHSGRLFFWFIRFASFVSILVRTAPPGEKLGETNCDCTNLYSSICPRFSKPVESLNLTAISIRTATTGFLLLPLASQQISRNPHQTVRIRLHPLYRRAKRSNQSGGLSLLVLGVAVTFVDLW